MRLVVLGSGGQGGVPAGDGDPLNYLGFLLLVILDLFNSWSYLSCPSAPLTPTSFLVQTYLSPITSLQTGGLFCGRLPCSPFRQFALDPVILPDEPISHGLLAAAPFLPPPPGAVL